MADIMRDSGPMISVMELVCTNGMMDECMTANGVMESRKEWVSTPQQRERPSTASGLMVTGLSGSLRTLIDNTLMKCN